MTAYVDDRHRAVVPRWRPVHVSITAGETAEPLLSKPHTSETDTLLSEKTRAWRSNGHPLWAADLLSCALVLDDPRAAHEAALALATAGPMPPFAHQFARSVLSPSPPDTGPVSILDPALRYQRIHDLRARLGANPRSAFPWLDLAYEYTCLGLTAKALKAAGTALALAPENRLLLRTTARLLVHTGDLEAAHDVLIRASHTQHDPWLLAAEVATATSAGRSPRYLRAARMMLTEKSRPPRTVSELGAALASLSLQAGRLREARRLFENALLEPTENALAQATWAWRQERTLSLGLQRLLVTPRSFEAAAWLAFQSGGWQDALTAAESWAVDQPFSSRPFILGSYLAAHTLEDMSRSVELARAGLRANPEDFSLLNNLAFALAYQGHVADGRRVFASIPFDSLNRHQTVVWLATDGLLEYRSGRPQSGRLRYQEAVEKARLHQYTRLEAVALARRALEEIRLGLPTAGSARDEALAMRPKVLNELDTQLLLDQVEKRTARGLRGPRERSAY